MLSRSNPGRPTIKESKGCVIVTFELRAVSTIPNPNRHLFLWADIKFKFAVLGMPLYLNAAIPSGNQPRGRRVGKPFEGKLDIAGCAIEYFLRDRHGAETVPSRPEIEKSLGILGQMRAPRRLFGAFLQNLLLRSRLAIERRGFGRELIYIEESRLTGGDGARQDYAG